MSERLQAEQAAASWIAKRDAGPWTAEDATRFACWLQESVCNRVAYYRLNGAWQEAGRLKALNGITALTPLSKSKKSAIARPHLRHFAIAASVLLAVGAAFLLPNHLFQRDGYSTVVGGLQAVPMSDGSKVTLNTDSKIHVALTETERRIELKQGEAFFEVAKDSNRPFVVTVGDRRIVAVGTAFSVRRIGDDIRVIVTEGKVRVEIPGRNDVLREPLVAGSIVRTEHKQVQVQTKPITEIEQTLSWRNGLLTFRNTPLADAVAEFNRYNVRKIVIEDPEISSIQIGGIFRATNLDPFVHLLQHGFPVRVSAQNDSIVLKSR